MPYDHLWITSVESKGRIDFALHFDETSPPLTAVMTLSERSVGISPADVHQKCKELKYPSFLAEYLDGYMSYISHQRVDAMMADMRAKGM